jgi:hypothetical protein
MHTPHITVKSYLKFVCAYQHLIDITRAEGLLTDNPNHQPWFSFFISTTIENDSLC